MHSLRQKHVKTRTHTQEKKTRQVHPKKKKKKIGGAHRVFSVTRQIVSDRDVTSILYADTPMGGG